MRVTLVAIASLVAACGGDDDWSGIRNPLVSLPDVATKDADLVHDAETWHLGYSRILAEPFRFQLGFSDREHRLRRIGIDRRPVDAARRALAVRQGHARGAPAEVIIDDRELVRG